MSRLTDAEILARFDGWFRRDGHWLYPTRERALAAWLGRGLSDLPDPTPSLRAALAVL